MARADLLDAEIVQVMSQSPIAWLEKKIPDDKLVLEDFSDVENVIILLFSENKHIFDDHLVPVRVVVLHEVIEPVSSVDLVVSRVLQHCRVKRVEREEIRH